jgi:hypothetical protein
MNRQIASTQVSFILASYSAFFPVKRENRSFSHTGTELSVSTLFLAPSPEDPFSPRACPFC